MIRSPTSLPPGAPRSPQPSTHWAAEHQARQRLEQALLELRRLLDSLAGQAHHPKLLEELARVARSRDALDRMFQEHPLGRSFQREGDDAATEPESKER